MVDLNELVIFAKVVEKGSFVGAARAMGVPKSTVSRKVAELEERLGTRLLVRTTRTVRPTEVGRAYFERATRIVAEVEEADRAVQDSQDTPAGLLRITTTMIFAQRYLAPLLGGFHDLHPRVEVEIAATDRIVDLVNEGFDLAIRAGRLADSSLVARRIGSGNTALVASPAYLARRGTPARVEDLRDHDCLLLGSGGGGQPWRVDTGDGPLTLTVTGPLVANDVEILHQAALVGMGITRLPVFLANEDVLAGRLVVVLPGSMPSDAGVFLVYPDSRQLSAKVRAFVEYFLANADSAPWRRETLG
jgi:DNA-binding transcriptional LysR family regulator